MTAKSMRPNSTSTAPRSTRTATTRTWCSPGCVYISQATEYGTLYTLAELEAIRKVCTKYDMPLFIDGARLGYALTATGNDVTLEDIARIADVFYIAAPRSEPCSVKPWCSRTAICRKTS